MRQSVDFIVIGGIARVFHGSAYPTIDTDILVSADPENLVRLAFALNALDARLMAGRDTLAVTPDPARLRMGMNFSWLTAAGQVDTFVEVEGGFRHEHLVEAAEPVTTAAGHTVAIASLEQLMAMKRPLARSKDRRDLEELEALKRLRQQERGRES